MGLLVTAQKEESHFKVKELCPYLAPIKFLEFAQEKEGLGKKKQMFCANFRPNGNWIETSIIHLNHYSSITTAFLIDLLSLWPWFIFTSLHRSFFSGVWFVDGQVFFLYTFKKIYNCKLTTYW